MRLLLIVPSFPKLSETFIVSKFLGLLERGWDVHVVCAESDPAQWQNFPDLAGHPEARHRVKVSWPHRPRWWAALLLPFAFFHCLGRNPVGTWRYARVGMRRFGIAMLRRFYLDAAVLALKPDLVHFEFGALAVDRMDIKELLGCRIVVSFRGYDLNFSGLDQPGFFDRVWKHADALHLLGNDLWQRALRRGCPADKPHALVAPAVNAHVFSPRQSQSGLNDGSKARPVRILSVGRLQWKKGYEHAIQAARLLRNAGVNFEYVIVGHGNFLEPLAYARHQLGLESEVRFLGAVSPLKVQEHLQEADIFLHAAVSEGFCNAVLEAQAMSLPVVCSDADGLSENVVDGESGFVVPRRNAQALADKLRLLARDAQLRTRMGVAGRRRVVKQFQPADQIGAFDRLYRTALSVMN